MEISGTGKLPNTSLSFRYTANNEALEELYHISEDDPPSPPCDTSPCVPSENASPKKADKSSSLLDKYFKSMRTEKPVEKVDDKTVESKTTDEARSTPVPKEVTSSPVKEYLNRLGKRTSTPSDVASDVKDKDSNETWKIFHDFKYKIAQAVEDIKTRSLEETKEKSVPRENSMSDSEENSAIKDDQQSVGDTDNQVSSLDSSIQNLSEMTQPLTAKPTEGESSLPNDNKNNSESSDDTHKNLVHSDSIDATKDILDDNMVDVESGVEALEDSNIDCFGDASNLELDCPDAAKPTDTFTPKLPPTPTNLGFTPSRNNLKPQTNHKRDKGSFFTFSMYFLTFFLLINYVLFPNSNIWHGFLLGIWFFYFVSTLKQWLLDNYFSEWEPSKSSFFQLKRADTTPIAYTIPSVKEYTPLKKYEGWINHYRYPDYDPYTYHINKTTTAFMKLEGCNLRISYTRTKISKKALWDEKIEKVAFYQHRLYNLTGARVILLPKGLVKRRQWSKKYPICIILSENEKIQVLEKENAVNEKKNLDSPDKKKEHIAQTETESIETNTSPEKKKKFVWRKREKSVSNENETAGKEGLRHRFARKMHRDKKTDHVSTCTEPESHSDKNQQDDFPLQEVEMESTKSLCSTKDDADEELDENELSKLKDFLEEAETETGGEAAAEGEWSVHVKHSANKHSRLYLLARTGRDKHEWYRRLMIAITEANAASAESSTADEKTGANDSLAETKDGIEMALYKVAEKDITFTKTTGKAASNVTDSSTSESKIPSPLLTPDLDSYEKHFWPYLFKIIQPKDSSPDCECRTLPGSVQWVNTALARLMFDVMRDKSILAKVQNRIQRKLHTLKLPSFMSPLTVTELSLSGACPLVARVWPPAADSRGLWLDAELRYEGGACITILTQINLMKLKEKNLTLEDQLFEAEENFHIESESKQSTQKNTFTDKALRKRKPAVYDSDVEDSAESSSDDESPPLQPVDSAERLPAAPLDASSPSGNPEGGSSKKKFLRMVDKIATNKYFQQVTDYKYVKRAMEGLSNTDIKLQVEVAALEGRLAINLPPPPHDRLWAGFRTNPRLLLRARPAVGARSLRFAHITNWIEQKLTKEFEKVLVLPNMEDIMIDIMTPTPVHFE